MVAVKILPAHLSSDPVRRQRFEREARAIAALQHSNICTLFDVGHENKTDFLVLPVPGAVCRSAAAPHDAIETMSLSL